MAFNFPDSPADGQQFASPGGPTYVFQNGAWMVPTTYFLEPPTPQTHFHTVGSAESADIDPYVNAIYVAGYSAPGDGGAALYKRVISEPAHAGKVQTQDGAWWEIAESVIDIRMIGAVPGVDAKPALVGAMAALGTNGGRVIIPKGDWLMAHTIDVPVGVCIEWAEKARIVRIDEAYHLFRPKGNNRFLYPKVHGVYDGVAVINGSAVFAMQDCSNVFIRDANLTNMLGDHYRVEDSNWITVENFTGQAGRNVVTINDDSVGSSHVYFRGGRNCSSYLIGFDAESDDDFPVSDVEIDIDWTQLGGVKTGSAVAFTRSTAVPASHIKYTKLKIRARCKDGLYGIILRGCKDVEIENLVTENVQEGMRIGSGFHVEDVRLNNFNINATHYGVIVESPVGFTRSRNIRFGAGRIHGLTQATAHGMVIDADEVTVSDEVLVDMNGAASSIGVRLDGDLCRTSATVCDARTAFVVLNGSTDRIIKAVGGIFKATTGSPVNEVVLTGTSPSMEVRDNRFCSTSTTGIAISDGNRVAFTQGNRGGDVFRGYVQTADATPTVMQFEGARAYVPVASGRACIFHAEILGRRSDGSAGTSAGYIFTGVARCTSGVVSFESTPTQIMVSEYATDAASFACTVTVTGAAGFQFTVTGVAAKTIAWNATVRLVQV